MREVFNVTLLMCYNAIVIKLIYGLIFSILVAVGACIYFWQTQSKDEALINNGINYTLEPISPTITITPITPVKYLPRVYITPSLLPTNTPVPQVHQQQSNSTYVPYTYQPLPTYPPYVASTPYPTSEPVVVPTVDNSYAIEQCKANAGRTYSDAQQRCNSQYGGSSSAGDACRQIAQGQYQSDMGRCH